jgi:MIP family channel proteins
MSAAGFLKAHEVKGSSNLLAIFAEGLGTFTLVFLAIATVIATGVVTGGEMDAGRIVAIALAFGLTIFLLVAAFGHISGAHVNPAVTLAAVVTGKMGVAKGVAYILAQVGGAVLAAYVLKAIVPGVYEAGLGANGINPDMAAARFYEGAAFALELILTFFLVWVVFAVAIDPRGPGIPFVPAAIGLVVLVDHLVGISFTGTSINPARSFGPALASESWDAH